ncbi:MAG: hypothetical protein C4K48_00575 [Candidatus Thorarchaeota archaeon]|nr:MAG: hypothetical protein C4K48_00575 [Candidatus Thorarchaeota archaeon]
MRTSHHAQWSEVNRRIIEAGLGRFLVVSVNQYKVGEILYTKHRTGALPGGKILGMMDARFLFATLISGI